MQQKNFRNSHDENRNTWHDAIALQKNGSSKRFCGGGTTLNALPILLRKRDLIIQPLRQIIAIEVLFKFQL